MSIDIRELDEAEIAGMYPLLTQLNPNMSEARFREALAEMLPRGYRCIGAFEAGVMIGVCGFTLGYRFWCGRQLDLDNFVIDAAARGKQVGQKMLRWLEALAAREQCHIIVLDSYATATDAHRFYHREGYTILGYHFVKKLRVVD
jgi:GNAT superfamily N-acetyltransferase